MSRVHHRTCCLCEASCGLTIELDGETITAIKGDPEDPLSRGHICPKAVALQDLHADPDRLRAPLRRAGRGWEEIGWDQALKLASEGLAGIQRRHGRHALATFTGNPAVHNYATLLYYVPAMRALRTHNRFSATSVDQLPRMLISYLMYGHQLLMPVPDVDRTDHLLILGANPLASNGSIMTAPGMERRLKDLKARGGKLIVVDPRRTETARLADQHHFIRPGGDAYLLIALLSTMIEEGLAIPGRLGPMLEGWDAACELARPWPAERVSAAVGIEASTIRQLARELAAAPSAAVYGRIGTCTQDFGALATWLIDLLNIATGNLDRPGGSMFSTPALDLVEMTARMGERGSFDRRRSRVRGLPEFGGEYPAVTLADEIETPGEGQVRGLLTLASNPALSTPGGPRLTRALQGLEFMVSIDPYLNETSRHADLILPPTSPLERDHYDAALLTFAVRNTARYSPPLFDPPRGSLHDWQILSAVARGVEARRSRKERLKALARRVTLEQAGPRRLLDLGLRLGPWGRGLRPGDREGLSLAALEASPHGVDLGPLSPRLPGLLKHAGGRIRVVPPALRADLDRLAAELPAREPASGSLLLIGRRHVLDNNSWMHNSRRLTKGKDRCTLLVSPGDASALGLVDGARAVVTSETGRVEVPVQVSDAMMPGVVSLPHGYGHSQEGARLGVASQRPGVSANELVDPSRIDALSGNASLSGQPVTVGPAL